LRRISVIGAGYVGLVSAVCFTNKGFHVDLSTHDPDKVEEVNKGISPFYELGLDELLKKAVRSGKLRAVLGRREAVLDSDVTFIAVGTPSKPDGGIDLQFIKMTSTEVGEALGEKQSYHLVVVRSTVLPGTTEKIVKPLVEGYSKKKAGIDFGLAMQPEFLRQGQAVYDTLNPDRIIIGEYDKKSGDVLVDLYMEFYENKLPPILRMNLPSAEMIKYASNAFLATKISFINEIANLCERIDGVDVQTVTQGMGLDERIGKHFLRAGVGYGGSCFPKDVSALIAFSKQIAYDPGILGAVTAVNSRQALHATDLARKELGSLKGKRIAVLGLSFKPGTDDLREAPSIKIIDQLLEEEAEVSAYDPVATENTRKILGDRILYAASSLQCLSDADCCILVTEWDEFKKLRPEDFTRYMRLPILIDGRRIYDPSKFSEKLRYVAIGLGRAG